MQICGVSRCDCEACNLSNRASRSDLSHKSCVFAQISLTLHTPYPHGGVTLHLSEKWRDIMNLNQSQTSQKWSTLWGCANKKTFLTTLIRDLELANKENFSRLSTNSIHGESLQLATIVNHNRPTPSILNTIAPRAIHSATLETYITYYQLASKMMSTLHWYWTSFPPMAGIRNMFAIVLVRDKNIHSYNGDSVLWLRQRITSIGTQIEFFALWTEWLGWRQEEWMLYILSDFSGRCQFQVTARRIVLCHNTHIPHKFEFS